MIEAKEREDKTKADGWEEDEEGDKGEDFEEDTISKRLWEVITISGVEGHSLEGDQAVESDEEDYNAMAEEAEKDLMQKMKSLQSQFGSFSFSKPSGQVSS